MQTTQITCDCGCGRQALNRHRAGWIVASQIAGELGDSEVKFSTNFHFQSLDCLKKWSETAAQEANELQDAAERGPKPRGSYVSKKVPGIYV